MVGNKVSKDENKSPLVTKSEDMIIEASTNDKLVTAETKEADKRKTEAETKDNKTAINGSIAAESRLIEPERNEAESRKAEAETEDGKRTTNDSSDTAESRPMDLDRNEVDNRKIETEKIQGKQAQSASSRSTAIQNKPAKRRITPMAIDP